MLKSTRTNTAASDTSALLHGIAADGGLYAPDVIPSFDYEAYRGKSYAELASAVMGTLLPGFAPCIEEAVKVYAAKFDDEAVTPLRKVGGRYILELWHGPTSAFKDLALSVLPYFMSYARKAEGLDEKVVILTATSGDTGKAALEGFHDVDGTEIVVFFPDGGVSNMQRLQMVTQEGNNVRVYAVRGNFDDCQRGVKETFAVPAPGVFLSSANSINIGRLVPQVVYYFYAYLLSGATGPLDFVVPTGNFGDILAGYIAKKMGLPVGKLICASNANNVLYDFLTTGTYDKRRELIKTTSPSMDILVSSNLERLLWYASGEDGEYVSSLMKELNENGIYTVSDSVLSAIREDFSAAFCDEALSRETIQIVWEEEHYLMDPHTAVAFSGSPEGSVVLSTASPFKFPAAIEAAIGASIASTGLTPPKNLVNLEQRPVLHPDVIDRADIIKVSLNKGDCK